MAIVIHINIISHEKKHHHLNTACCYVRGIKFKLRTAAPFSAATTSACTTGCKQVIKNTFVIVDKAKDLLLVTYQ